jgi:hypothetical protein
LKFSITLLFSLIIFISSLGASVKFDNDGMITINGKRTFIIGSYHLPKSETPYAELSKAGFNLLRIGNNVKEFKNAQKAGLKVWYTLGTLDLDKVQQSKKTMLDNINKFKNHPALLIWESVDEPAWTWNKAEARIKPGPFIKAFNFIKKYDPNHLLYMNHAPVNLESTLREYNGGTDIVACDIYPVIPEGIKPMFALFPNGEQGDLSNTSISQVGEYANKMRRVAGPNRPVFMVLQGFAWEMLRKEADRDSSKILFPTLFQNRFMAYNAIIHGANGIVYWGTSYTPQPSEFWTDLKKVTNEVSSISHIISSKNSAFTVNKKYHEMGHSVDAGIEILVKNIQNKLYLITANADKNPVKITLGDVEGFNTCTVLFENRQIDIRQNSITDTYKPFDVHIYKFSKN